ncbi:S100 calcium binding protein W isoform X1 [Esox lucius]|nr:S100 calcium binding protein W [Esox lucius]XP_010892715.1 S100 calcium binding protein W isoform X1 [Esox lucius]ACO13524.1 S100-B [Esox lucius]ACO13973.1 S100-B [Esox lucius]
MSQLEKAIISMVEVFDEYARKDDKKNQLSSAEMAKLMNKELAGPEFNGKVDQKVIDEALEKLDKNHDGETNFREFSMFLATLARGYYRATKTGKGNKSKSAKPE